MSLRGCDRPHRKLIQSIDKLIRNGIIDAAKIGRISYTDSMKRQQAGYNIIYNALLEIEVDHATLNELVEYHPKSGKFFWKKAVSNKTKVGAECGCTTKQGYVVLRLLGKLYQANQLVWLYVHGEMPRTRMIYVNGDKSDNRLENIVATQTERKPRKARTTFKPTITTPEWLKRFSVVHGDLYDYSKVDISGATNKATITCRKHGDFAQTPSMHAEGRGCPKCANEQNGLRFRHTMASIIARFKETHGDRYDYSAVDCDMATSNVTIICKSHGPFEQHVSDHINGCGCPKCYAATVRPRSKRPWGEIYKDFVRMHGAKYEYDIESYTHAKGKLRIICPEHGPFMQTASDHANGCGCPMCIDLTNPKPNRELAAFIEDLGFEVTREAKVFGDRRAADIVVPSRKVLIEHNGAWWHSEKYRLDARTHLFTRVRDARYLGFRTLFFFDDEWRTRKAQCKTMIRNALGLTEKLNARQCQFELLDGGTIEAKAFMEHNHIQGATPCSLYAVLRYECNIVMAASFGTLRSNRCNTDESKWELSRMASCKNVRGGASKIMSNLLRVRDDIRDITTYYDHRLFNGGAVYAAMGFKPVKTYGPDYTYVNWNKRYHKSQFQKANIQKKFGIDMTTGITESDAMNSVGYFRVWDCGKTRYEIHR